MLARAGEFTAQGAVNPAEVEAEAEARVLRHVEEPEPLAFAV